MTRVHVLTVFTGPEGRGGNPLGVIVTGSSVPPSERQAMAARLGYSETVFVDDPEQGTIRIFTPRRELAFAGHPTVGTGGLLARLGFPGDVLRPSAGEVPTWRADGGSWIRGPRAGVPPMPLQPRPIGGGSAAMRRARSPTSLSSSTRVVRMRSRSCVGSAPGTSAGTPSTTRW